MEHKLRLITGALGIALIGAVYWFFELRGLQLITFVIAIVSYYEYLQLLLHPQNTVKLRKLKTASALFFAALFFLSSQWNFSLVIFVLLLAMLFWLSFAVISAAKLPLELTIHDVLIQTFGLLYIFFSLAFLPMIHILPNGVIHILNLILIIWVGDSFAYYGGKRFGRKKLAALVSPKKTWAGAISGMLGALVSAIAVKFYFPLILPLGVWVFITVCVAAIAQIGDLFESLIKRSVHVKDSGKLLPGHGGMFDRFDSLILATPFYYFLLTLFS